MQMIGHHRIAPDRDCENSSLLVQPFLDPATRTALTG